MSWLDEFGPAYAVPREVLETPDVFDCSWHNDVCPSFCLPGCDGVEPNPDVRLWVDHPDPEQREFGDHRYVVSTSETNEEHYHGDDLVAALAEWHRVSAAAAPTSTAGGGWTWTAPTIGFVVLSPDGLPIAPERYPTRDAAWHALAVWCLRFAPQGYYAAADGTRIAVTDLPGRCAITEVKP